MKAEKFSKLLEEAGRIMNQEPSHLELPDDLPMVFIGDTHGDVITSYRIARQFRNHRLVFLGDYIDRAPERGSSITNLAYLLRLKVREPERVTLLRGNHEFKANHDFALLMELDKRLGDVEPEILETILATMKRTFSHMPYAASTENGVLALHGGIPNVQSLDDIASIRKGMIDYNEDWVASQIVWNESLPEKQFRFRHLYEDGSGPNRRGINIPFAISHGQEYLDRKLKGLGKTVLIRGHDFEQKGLSMDNKVLTVFSSTEYERKGPLKGTFVAVMDDPKAKIRDARDLRLHFFN